MNRGTNGTRKDNTYVPLDNIKRIFNEENQIDYDKLLEDYSLLAEEDIFLKPRVTFNDKTRTKNDIICHRIMDKQTNPDLDFDIINFVEIWREVKSKFSYKKKNDPNFHQLCEFMNDWEKISYKMQKLYDILYFAERRKSRENLRNFTNNLLQSFTNNRYFIQNSSFAKLNDFDIEPLVSQYKKTSVLKCMQDNDLSSEEINVLLRVSQKCWPWNRKKILQRLLIKDGNGRSGLNRIADIVNNLPIDQVDDFYKWLYENRDNLITRNGLVNDLWERAQQEVLLQLVPQERKDEFRNLFQNKNFRKVCQTPQAIKNLLIIREVCPNFSKYINVDQKMALDTFDIDKIRGILGDKLNQLPPNVESVYLFRFFNKWCSILSHLDSSLPEKNKEKLLKCPQLACAKDQLIDQFLLEISDFSQNKGNNYFNYVDKIFSKEAIEHFHENVESELEFEAIETLARNFLGINDNESLNVGSFKNSYMMLATIDFEDESYFKPEVLVTLSPNSIVNLLNFASQKGNLNFYQGLIKKLGEDKLYDTKIAVMKIFSKSRQTLGLEAFENNKIEFVQFLKSAETVDIFFFINSKEDVLELSGLLKAGLDIDKISIKDFNAMKSLIDNVSDKNLWRKKFVEFSNVDEYKGDFIYQIINFAEALNDKSDENKIYEFLENNVLIKETFEINSKFINDILSLKIMPEKLNVIYNQMNKLANENKSFQFMKKLMPDEENIPKMQNDLDLNKQIL